MAMTHAGEQGGTILVCTFVIEDSLYGLDTMKAQEVVRVGDITPVHHARDYIMGIINLRGKIVTIIDLCRKLGMESARVTPDSRIIIVNWENEYVGLLVDRIADVVSAEVSKLTPPPSNVRGTHGKFFEGVYQTDANELIAILNIQTVLSDDDA